MKRIFPLVSLFYFLSSCNFNNIANQSKGNVDNCPQSPKELPKIKITKSEDVFTAFNYQIKDIAADADKIHFQSPNYDFIFCRGNNNWTVEPVTFKQQNNDRLRAELANPSFQTIELNQTSYQYRVILEPNPFPEFRVEPQKVIFELILPHNPEAQRQVVYTLEQTKKAEAGIQLGVPSISSTFVGSDRFLMQSLMGETPKTALHRLFWSISPEQGEGNGGIATIVSYNPQTEKITIIQPAEIARQQINDLVISGETSNPIRTLLNYYSRSKTHKKTTKSFTVVII